MEMNIILIEEDEMVSEAVSFLLREDGHQVIKAMSPEEVLRSNYLHEIDLVLCDLLIATKNSSNYSALWDHYNALNVPVVIIAIEDEDDSNPLFQKKDFDGLLQELHEIVNQESGKRPDDRDKTLPLNAGLIPEDIKC